MSESNSIPIDPAAVTLMASIVAKSLKTFSNANPQTSLSSDATISALSENIAVDMISAVSQLASQVAAVGDAPTRPQNLKQRQAVNAYKDASKIKQSSFTKRNDFLDRLGMEDKQYPESD